jgi:hypothetical protein
MASPSRATRWQVLAPPPKASGDTSRRFRYKTFVPNIDKLSEFVAWCQQHITGDEKGQAPAWSSAGFTAGFFGLAAAAGKLEC